jgi:hypothetical protein
LELLTLEEIIWKTFEQIVEIIEADVALNGVGYRGVGEGLQCRYAKIVGCGVGGGLI